LNYSGKFDGKISADGLGLHANGHAETIHATHAPSDAIVVPDAHLLFLGDYKRSGVDLIISKDDRELVLHDYFKGEKRAALSSPDGAHLTGDLVNALSGHVQYAQADGSASAGKVIGHVTKLVGTVTAMRNGVVITLNAGDNVEKGDVVQSGSDSKLIISFIDGTVFAMSADARMVLNEMVYDPNGSDNSSLLSLVAGTISFVAGETAKHGDMKVATPVATMGIRGTAILTHIDIHIPLPPLDPGAPPLDLALLAPSGNFLVLVEPDGHRGSAWMYEPSTLTPLAELKDLQINISQGTVTYSNEPLPPDWKNQIDDLFTSKFSANPKSLFTQNDTIIPNDGTFGFHLPNGLFAFPVFATADHTSGNSPNTTSASTPFNFFIPLQVTVDQSTAQEGTPIHATSSGATTYNWQVSDDNGKTFTTVSTAAAFTPGEGDEGKLLELIVSNASGSKTFNFGTVAEDPTENPSILLTGLTSGHAVEGTLVTASVTDLDAPASSNITYTWTVDGLTKASGLGLNSYTPTETDEGKALTVSVSFTDTHGFAETGKAPAGTVNPVADVPVVTASAAATNENSTSTLALSLTNATALFENSDDSVTVTVTLDHGATLTQTGSGATVTANEDGTFTVTAHSTADLAGLTITPASEFEGTVNVGISAVTHDGSAVSAAGTTSTTLTVNPVAEAGTASAPATLTLNENATNVAIAGVSVGPLAEDSDDTVSAVLAVGHGTLHVGSLDGVTVTANGTASVTVAGSAALVNTVLAGLTYTPTTEFNGSDSLHVTVTSIDGSNTSATRGLASTAITVNDGPNDLVATLDHATAEQGVTMHVTGVKDGGITVTTGVSYKWQDSSNNGLSWTTVGTSSSYTPGESDEGKLMQLVVTYVDAGGSESSTYSLGMPNDLVATADSTYAKPGTTIHVNANDGGTNDPSSHISYAWEISGDNGQTWSTVGTNSSYEPTSTYAGDLLQVVVTYVDPGEKESATISFGNIATKVWLGGSHDWQTTSQWNSSGVPSSGDYVVVDASGTYTVTIDHAAFAHSLIVNDTNAKIEIVAGNMLTLGGNLTIDAGNVLIDSAGTLKDTAISATITGTFTDNGTVEAGGNLEIASAVASGSGSFKIDAGASLQLDHADPLNVIFAGSGELILKDPTHFSGTISDSGVSMTPTDLIDVAGFDTGASVSYLGTTSGGIVTIIESGHTTVHLTVGANSTSWGAPVSDGDGGILIHDPPVDSGQTLSGVIMQDPGPAGSTIVATAPNQTLTGIGASDTFVFNFATVGHTTVTDFDPDSDTLQFKSPIFESALAALNAAQDDGHGNTVIAIDAHDTVTLSGVLKAQLHGADFHVV
jgi:hypothetical protein